MDLDAYFSSIQPIIHWVLVVLIVFYTGHHFPAYRPDPFQRQPVIALAGVMYSIVKTTSPLQSTSWVLSAFEICAILFIKTLSVPIFLGAILHLNLLFLYGHTLMNASSIGVAVACAFHAIELFDTFASHPLLFTALSAFKRLFSFVFISSRCSRELRHQPLNTDAGTAAIEELARNYVPQNAAHDIRLISSNRLFVLRAILAQFWRPLVKVALGEALLGVGSVWKEFSTVRIFALASGQAEPAEVVSTLLMQYALSLLLLAFATFHAETKGELSTQIENALHRPIFKALVTAPGSSHSTSALSQAKVHIIEPYVSALFQAVNCLSPIAGIAGSIAISHSLFGWRVAIIAAIVIALTVLSEWISSKRTVRLATQRQPQTLRSRLEPLMPCVQAFKMLAIEDAVFKASPGEFFDDHVSSILAALAKTVDHISKGVSKYIAVVGLTSTPHGQAVPADIIQTLALLQQTSTSCGDLVRSAGVFAELAQLETVIKSRLVEDGSYIRETSNNRLTVSMTGAKFTRRANGPVALRAYHLKIKPGQLVAVTGAVGAGKSTLLLAILRELNLVSGESHASGSMAYVGQPPWIMGATVQDNILFGRPKDIPFYKQVVALCCLEKDISNMPENDMTLVGNQGANLSGGQKARLALARALYSQADVYLLDDTLAEIDAGVQSTIWANVLSNTGGALKGKTRVVVTNDRKYVNQCDVVVHISDGCARAVKKAPTPSVAKVHQLNTGMPASGSTSAAAYDAKATDQPKPSAKARRIQPESTPFEALQRYFQICGFWSMALAIVVGLLTAAVPIFLRQHQSALLNTMNSEDISRAAVLENYARYSVIIAIVDVLLHWIKLGAQEWVYISFNRPKLVGTLLSSLITARMSEIWRTGDLNILAAISYSERDIILGVHAFAADRTANIASILYSAYSTYLISSAALLILFGASVAIAYARKHSDDVLYAVQKCKMGTRRQKNETIFNAISGSLTVRVFRAYRLFDAKILKLDSTVAGIHRLAMAILNARQFYRAAIEEFLVLMLVGIMSMKSGKDTAADVQIYHEMLTSSLPLLKNILSIQRDAMNHANALQEYCDKTNMKSEGARHVQNAGVPEKWPEEGGIKFADCIMRYSGDGKPALRGITACIRGGEKVGIVGRTGSGKSSLINALLRIVELEAGAITVDGIDISKIGVHDLRQQISVVPQVAALFEGTLRANVDPFGRYSDAEVDAAIQGARLGDLGADKWIEVCGRNISAGQRQLVALCRAVLQRRRIVVLDEATASIDNETARLVGEIVVTEFKDSTVLTIAHRLKAVSASDRILVVGDGRVEQFDTPAVLGGQEGPYADLLAADRGLDQAAR